MKEDRSSENSKVDDGVKDGVYPLSVFVDWTSVLEAVTTSPARRMWMRIMQGMAKDGGASGVVVVPKGNGMTRQAVWMGLRQLTGWNLIKPVEDSHWGVVRVNPLVCRPYWLKGKNLERRIKEYAEVPANYDEEG
jgi:hypothetical protein